VTDNNALLLDVNAVGALLACSPRTVFRLADCGLMPRGVKLGALRRWNRSEIEAFIAAGCKPSRTLKKEVR
jgi:predicted DNA-binding transcriptional regulator AlpA